MKLPTCFWWKWIKETATWNPRSWLINEPVYVFLIVPNTWNYTSLTISGLWHGGYGTLYAAELAIRHLVVEWSTWSVEIFMNVSECRILFCFSTIIPKKPGFVAFECSLFWCSNGSLSIRIQGNLFKALCSFSSRCGVQDLVYRRYVNVWWKKSLEYWNLSCSVFKVNWNFVCKSRGPNDEISFSLLMSCIVISVGIFSLLRFYLQWREFSLQFPWISPFTDLRSFFVSLGVLSQFARTSD